MFFRQLFDRKSCTYTYVLADEITRDAVIIDPVDELAARDLQLLDEWGLRLRYILETHVHADHVTGGGALREASGAQTVVAAVAGVDCADIQAKHGDTLNFGSHNLEVRSTPGHTGGCITFVHHAEGLVFTGDTLFVRGCGRTDFQEGDAATLYKSVHEQIFSLPDGTRVYPAHDYKGRTVSTVGEEKAYNPRLGGGNTVEQFVAIMESLKLSDPAMMHIAVPANLACGRRAEAGTSASVIAELAQELEGHAANAGVKRHTMSEPAPGRTVSKSEVEPQVTAPVCVVEEGSLQSPTTRYRLGEVTFEMAHLDAGTFMMGSTDDDDDAVCIERPRHEVRLTRAFSLGVHPVTQALYAAVMKENPSEFEGALHPVENVNWYDAVRFCNRLSEAAGLECAYVIGSGEEPTVTCDFRASGFRLPTEAEWEYAARAGTAFRYAGSDDLDAVGWHGPNSDDQTHPVGGKAANGWGLYDLSGNVSEWCWDWFGDYASGSVADPTGPQSGAFRVPRGGSWCDGPRYARVACRHRDTPGNRFTLGLRLARTRP